MSARNPINPIASWQKIYDDAHLICSTAIYFESLPNEREALRCWRNALEQLLHQQYYNRLPAGYAPKSATERALLESLKKLEAQCRERVDLLAALETSRRESGDPVAGDGAPGGTLGGGTVPPMEHADLARPPPLPTRPPPEAGMSAEGRGNASPERKVRLRSSLRPGTGRPRGEGREAGPPAAAKAATQAWVAKKSKSRTGREVAGVQEGVEGLDVGEGRRERGGARMRKQSRPVALVESADPFSDDAELRLASSRSGGYDSSDMGPLWAGSRPAGQSLKNVKPVEDFYGGVDTQARQDHTRRKPQTGSYTVQRRHMAVRGAAQRDHVEVDTTQESISATVKRKPVKEHLSKVDSGTSLAGSTPEENVSADEEDEDVDEEEPLSREQKWRIFSTSVLQNLPRGTDRHAAEQILNEVIVQGDEVHWEDIAGLDNAKAALKENVVYPFLRPDLFLGLREPARGMLLFGPPGTGKTMLARAVATEAKSTFFAISASSLIAKFLGESEKLVRALFSLAKMLAPSIIFVDEIDSLLSSRSGDGEHEATRRIKTEFLIQWSDLARAAAGRERPGKEKGDASRVLVLAATNVPWAIDEAARRRFVRRQYIPLPEAPVRAMQFGTLLKYQIHQLEGRDIEKLVELTEGFSGSDITALAKDAAMGPLRSLGDQLLLTKTEDIRPIGMQDFLASLQTIRPSVSKQGLEKFEDWAKEFGERGG